MKFFVTFDNACPIVILRLAVLAISHVMCEQDLEDQLYIPCVKNGACSCVVTDPKDSSQMEYSLWPFNNNDGTPNLSYPSAAHLSAAWTFQFNLCTGFTSKTHSVVCRDVCGCQISSDKHQAFAIAQGGGPSSFGPFNYNKSMLSVSYKKTKNGRSMKVNLTHGSSTVITETEEPTKHYTFAVKSERFQGHPIGSKKHNGVSVGSILVIIFFVLLIVYLVAGVLFMKYKRQASGKDLIPNLEFWTSLPGLIKDGCIFFGKKVKSLCSKNDYEEI